MINPFVNGFMASLLNILHQYTYTPDKGPNLRPKVYATELLRTCMYSMCVYDIHYITGLMPNTGMRGGNGSVKVTGQCSPTHWVVSY